MARGGIPHGLSACAREAGPSTARFEEGLLKACLPQELGGAGGRVLDAVLITETLAQSSSTAVNMFLVNAVFSGTTLLVGGTDKQKAEFLPQTPLLDPPSQYHG